MVGCVSGAVLMWVCWCGFWQYGDTRDLHITMMCVSVCVCRCRCVWVCVAVAVYV